jgi:hypothetical protein
MPPRHVFVENGSNKKLESAIVVDGHVEILTLGSHINYYRSCNVGNILAVDPGEDNRKQGPEKITLRHAKAKHRCGP